MFGGIFRAMQRIDPGGDFGEALQAILAYLGKDATEEWVMIHKPGWDWPGWVTTQSCSPQSWMV